MLLKRTWIGVSLLGFIGALAWAVENQFFNTFVYDTITPDPRPISWMVAASAITATLTSILMGALSDRTRTHWGRRRPFILVGYLLWGVATAAFPSAALFHPIGLAVGMAILFDCVMTFFGSTANDAALNAYVTDVTTPSNRGRLVSVLYIASAVANLIIYAGAGMIIERWGYFPLFYLIGGGVILLGLIGGLLIQEPPLPSAPVGSYWGQIADTFRWQSLRQHRDFFLLLLAMGLWGVAQQIFFPYLLIYLNHYLDLPPSTATLLVFIAILFGSILSAYPLGLLTDRWGRKRMAALAVLFEIIGLSAFSLARSEATLALTGILWLGAGTAWGIATNAWSKDLFPEDKRGQFAGYVILFTVAFTMIPGPLVGGWLATHYGIPTVLNGKPGFIPTPLIFQAAAAATILAALPLVGVRVQPRQNTPNQT
ncbi:MFS transporter [Thermanaerothrix sp. 4228-RoL]|uniref:MFS transporter n=2 Tax=Thermanaerothrix TaxID=1077886 RepID=A0ABU3NP80_9CHLR|nr:MFS transporter [Thermanaerothrix sp. 4228-RoL]MDT8898646.1 MFS transporter [Thermanaerothrix sp. 4228-RoL]